VNWKEKGEWICGGSYFAILLRQGYEGQVFSENWMIFVRKSKQDFGF
jgi:hypothetical protein